MRRKHDWFWFEFPLVEKVARILLTSHRQAKPKQTRNYFRHSTENRSVIMLNRNIMDNDTAGGLLAQPPSQGLSGDVMLGYEVAITLFKNTMQDGRHSNYD